MSKPSSSTSPRSADDPPRVGIPLRPALTLLAPCSIVLLQQIGLPGVDESALEAPAGKAVSSAFGLGVAPFLSAAAIVELAAVLVPRWSGLRHGGPAGRARLARSTALLGVALAAFQAYSIAVLLSSSSMTITPGMLSTSLITITLVAGASCLVLLAALASQRALAGGMMLLIAGAPLVTAAQALFHRSPSLTPLQILVLALEVAGVAAATILVLRPLKAQAVAEREPTYRTVEKPGAPRAEIPAPASGIAPLLAAASILAVPAAVARMNPSRLPFAGALASDVIFVPLTAALLVLLTLGLGWLFNRPERVAMLRAGADEPPRAYDELVDEARAELRPALARTLLFVGTLFFLGHLARRLAGELLQPAEIALAAALALDVVAELRARRALPDLVPVWPEHRPYAIAAAREALAAAGITVHARGEGVRRLLQFFGPYVPIELMVPRADAKRATKILERVLLVGAEGERAAPARSPGRRAEPGLASALQGRKGAALAVLALGIAALPFLQSAPRPSAPSHPSALEIIAVDDVADIDVHVMDPLPAGASLQLENVPTGPGSTAPRHYVRLVLQEGESMAQARARLQAWTDSLPLPDGDRALLGKVIDEEDDKDAGWRTYLVKGPSTITGADVAGATAQEDPTSGGAHVTIELTPAGAERFAALTRVSVKRRVAILVDREVKSAPVVQSEIKGGFVVISMGRGPSDKQLADAKKLAASLRGD